MGKVILTTGAFKEWKVASEFKNFLLTRGLNVNTIIFNKYPGFFIIECFEKDSITLGRIITNTAILIRLVKKVIPVIYEFNISSLNDIINHVINFLKENVEFIKNCSTFLVRCEFRGFRGEYSVEKEIGKFIKENFGIKVSTSNPECIIIIQCVENWCGIYVGKYRESFLRYKA